MCELCELEERPWSLTAGLSASARKIVLGAKLGVGGRPCPSHPPFHPSLFPLPSLPAVTLPSPSLPSPLVPSPPL